MCLYFYYDDGLIKNLAELSLIALFPLIGTKISRTTELFTLEFFLYEVYKHEKIEKIMTRLFVMITV